MGITPKNQTKTKKNLLYFLKLWGQLQHCDLQWGQLFSLGNHNKVTWKRITNNSWKKWEAHLAISGLWNSITHALIKKSVWKCICWELDCDGVQKINLLDVTGMWCSMSQYLFLTQLEWLAIFFPCKCSFSWLKCRFGAQKHRNIFCPTV